MGQRGIMKTLSYECDACRGTGLYSGFCEGPGHAVVCLGCNGTGRAEFQYTPFTERKLRRDIKTVSLSKGRFIFAGVGPTGDNITYKEFLEGKLSYKG
jgi:hypothetical protein